MQLEHIAITVSQASEIKDFYINVLGMHEERSFALDGQEVSNIFNSSGKTPVHYLTKNGITLEIFVSKHTSGSAFNHLCISFPDRDDIVARAIDKNYKVVEIPRNRKNLIFIHDSSGNKFEIK